jgi:hypothetical protein
MLSPADDALVAAQLGRRLRGVVAVAARCPVGHPAVITCYPLRRTGKRIMPFPTLYWLVCPALDRAVADLERGGAIVAMERELADDALLRERVSRDHDDYIARRWATLTDEDRAYIESHHLREGYFARGIGGMVNRAAVKCLHLHVAHELAGGNAIGARVMKKNGLGMCAM